MSKPTQFKAVYCAKNKFLETRDQDYQHKQIGSIYLYTAGMFDEIYAKPYKDADNRDIDISNYGFDEVIAAEILMPMFNFNGKTHGEVYKDCLFKICYLAGITHTWNGDYDKPSFTPSLGETKDTPHGYLTDGWLIIDGWR